MLWHAPYSKLVRFLLFNTLAPQLAMRNILPYKRPEATTAAAATAAARVLPQQS
jgi:hypothetical protein